MPTTSFDPARHGFTFANTFSTNLIFDWRFGGLCGGMTYAALDFFTSGVPVPRDSGRSRPPDGSPLFDYIYQRQVQSIYSNLDKWGELILNPFGWRTDEFFRWGLDRSAGGRIGELQATVGAGRPVPLGLFKEGGGGVGPHHQVLAIGFDGAGAKEPDEGFRIEVYDPNRPGVRRRLMPEMATRRWCFEDSGAGERWITYFVDRKYTARRPPAFAPAGASSTAGAIAALSVSIATGGDDLRGGGDNVDIAVITRSGEVVFGNVNRSARWIDNYTQTVRLPLTRPIERADLAAVELRTHFGGGWGGDNWNVDSVTVTDDRGTRLASARGNPLVRFTGDHHVHRVAIPR